jgi:hypothetical protein
LKEPSGLTTTYSIAVFYKGDRCYEVALLIGNALVVSYHINLRPVIGQAYTYTASEIVEIVECVELK